MNKRYKQLRVPLKYVFLLFFAAWVCACSPNEDLAQRNIQNAKRAVSEDKIDEAKNFLKLVPRNSKAWNAEGKALSEGIDNRDATNIRKAKESLASGRLDDAKKYLNMVDVKSEEWKKEGLTLFGQVWEKEKNSPDRIRKEEEAANYVKKLSQSRHGVKFNWEKSGFGTVAILTSITIENTLDETCKDINGIMSFFAASGTKLGALNFTIYDIVSPHSKRTFKDINVGIMPSPVDQVKSAAIEILDCK